MKAYVFKTLLLTFFFIIFSCEDTSEKKPEERQCLDVPISGTWKAIKVRKTDTGELWDVASFENLLFNTHGHNPHYLPHYTEISITIPDAPLGNIIGHTFRNVFGGVFEINEVRQISFESLIPLRRSEDVWSSLFRQNFNNTKSYCFSNEELLFLDAYDEPLIVFERTLKEYDCEEKDYSYSDRLQCSLEPISGTWKADRVWINVFDELICIINPFGPPGISYSKIQFTISYNTDGTVMHLSGHTFVNSVGFSFDVMDEQLIRYKTGFETRAGEENWGLFFRGHIQNIVRYCLVENELILFDTENKPVIVFIKTTE